MDDQLLNQLDLVLAGLMQRYRERVPDVAKTSEALSAQGIISQANDIENDHIAFRTLGVTHLGIQSLEKVFLHYGYTKRDHLYFEQKKLDAFWYAPPQPHYPRIFISELRVGDFPEEFQNLVKKYTDHIQSDPVKGIDLDNPEEVDAYLHKALWPRPSFADYQALLSESEYAAWAIFNSYYLNHYTISVHNLPQGYNTLEEFNAFLENIDIKLNDSGGKIKKSPDGLLLQSSTVAQIIEAEFADGDNHPIAGSYVEFAERKVLPQFAHLPKDQIRREHRRDGFEAGNADKIFESTYTHQIQKS